MGDVIDLEARRRARARRGPAAPAGRQAVSFAFDLADAETYLAAERVDRLFAEVTWLPVLADDLVRRDARVWAVPAPADAERRAAALRMPLIWPEERPARCRGAQRVAHLAAAEHPAGVARFVLAAGRLAFCGGYDLDDPEILREAIAASGLPEDACLQAAADAGLDDALRARAAGLVAAGADRLPVLQVGQRLFCGEENLAGAAAAARVG